MQVKAVTQCGEQTGAMEKEGRGTGDWHFADASQADKDEGVGIIAKLEKGSTMQQKIQLRIGCPVHTTELYAL